MPSIESQLGLQSGQPTTSYLGTNVVYTKILYHTQVNNTNTHRMSRPYMSKQDLLQHTQSQEGLKWTNKIQHSFKYQHMPTQTKTWSNTCLPYGQQGEYVPMVILFFFIKKSECVWELYGSYHKEGHGTPTMYSAILNVSLVCQVIRWFDGDLHPLHCQKRSQIGCIRGDDYQSECPPERKQDIEGKKYIWRNELIESKILSTILSYT